ncbi:glycosyltransferase family 2 protein [Mucilaginibacter daejeonensis]|uniref:glycosyltransferase n=1 Tax=Mucilaginibacter daejeonensis TaxID=398049 RepID=UPI001D17A155|nr:glycosyltransferase [Mucilaginibacter daejeonensis]UEG51476.1 glycosyltransferase family 2 protein [Mucilaginibacter daejeonensis]
MKRISFCITCLNRFHQVSKTLPKNLLDNIDKRDIVEFILIDFNSTDGLKSWIEEDFSEFMKDGYLKFYHTDLLKSWDCSIAKNTAHLHATGDIVVNLDCDNYTGPSGGLFVLDQFERYGENIILHQSSSEPLDGSFGRIGLAKRYFEAVGGYDQSFDPMGYQDIDLIHRLQIFGLNYISQPANLYNQAIPNTKEDSVKNAKSSKNYYKMTLANMRISKRKIDRGEIIANKGQYGILIK